MSEILRELAEEVAVDLRSGLGCVDGQVSGLRGHERRNQNRSVIKPKPGKSLRMTSSS